ncbi:MAG: asparagine synthase C-terminal domain-containing protein [Candidatus Hodarchaeales archaeon]|jgi:asparagine synthase (glutamine-hydrolysing)
MNRIKKKLEEIICDHQNNAPLGLLYSGGLDSTIIASIMTKCLPFSSFNLVSVGFPESYDIKNASLGAGVLGVNYHKCYLSIEIIRETINSLKHLKVIHNPVHLTIAIPLYLGLQMMSEGCHTRTVFMGQGADELFCGYRRYSLMYEEDKIDQIDTVMSDDLKSLMEKQVKMEVSLANHFRVSLVYPYLDPEIIEVARSFPIESHT